MSSNNPYQGFDSPYMPNYGDPFNSCGCGAASACGNEHQPTVKIQTVTRTTATGAKETVHQVAPLGHIYTSVAHVPFTTWDGSLASNDLYLRKGRPYQPPALPFVCDRPLGGSSLCSASTAPGSCSP